MPRYPYVCTKCENKFEIIKSVSEIENPEFCKCGESAYRTIGLVNFNNAGDWKPTFNPGLGCVVKSERHKREILSKLRGEGREMVEVGNEPIENIVRDSERTQKEIREKRWSESTEKIMSEVL